MELSLKNPIIIFDLETTGINIATDRIVEIALIKVNLNGEETEKVLRINPEMPIPKESSDIHGITDEDIKDCPTFKEKAKEIAQFIEGCDLGGFNSNRFDIPLLSEEFLRVGTDIDLKRRKFVDVQTIFHKMEKRTLEAAYNFYCGETLENAHSALADTRATYEVLKAQLDRYNGVSITEDKKVITPVVNDMAKLAEFSCYNESVDFASRIVYNDEGVEVFNFGKNKGIPVTQVLKEQPGYYNWMLNSDFPLYTKKVLTEIKLRMVKEQMEQ